MKLTTCSLEQAKDTILVHNIAFPSGRAAVRKGTRLTEPHLVKLKDLGHQTVLVAILEDGDVSENDAAAMLGDALQSGLMQLSRPAGGRINFQTTQPSMLEVDVERLLALNMIEGIALATRIPFAALNTEESTAEFATLKIIPYAIPQHNLEAALEIIQAKSSPLLNLRPLPTGAKVALLLTGEPAVHAKVRTDFEEPIRVRLKRLHADLVTVETTPQANGPIQAAAKRLVGSHDLLIVAGQTSIMDSDDITPHALSEAGAEVTVFGAPVEPGNLLTLAYFLETPVMCAPGCARSLAPNIVDMLLPRLLLGDRLGRADIAAYGLGGFLKTR